MTKEITLKDVTSSKVTLGKVVDFPAIGNNAGITAFKKGLEKIRNIEARTLVSSSDGGSMLVSITPKKGKKLVVCKRITVLAKTTGVRIPSWVKAWALKHDEYQEERANRKVARHTRRGRRVHRVITRKPQTFFQRVRKAVSVLMGK